MKKLPTLLSFIIAIPMALAGCDMLGDQSSDNSNANAAPAATSSNTNASDTTTIPVADNNLGATDNSNAASPAAPNAYTPDSSSGNNLNNTSSS